MTDLNIPTALDWEGYELSSDSIWTHGIFFGKSKDELRAIFESNPVDAAENIFRIPEKAFAYYFLQFGCYAKSIADSDDLSKSDAASAFLNYLLAAAQKRPHSIHGIASRLLDIGDYISMHQAEYCADEEMYGNFRDVYEESKAYLNRLS